MDKQVLADAFLNLVDVVHELREKCPWDRKQTKDSLRHLSIEEVYELSDAILDHDWDEIKVELGDILLHILFYSLLGEEQNKFSTAEMIDTQREKLIRRHPHIYGDVQADSAEQVTQNWEQIKLKEKGGKKKKVLSGVPNGLPSLIKALRIQEKVRNVGFDWDHEDQVWEKVREELNEFETASESYRKGEGEKKEMEMEFGDLMFSLVNYARFLDINPEDALEMTNKKFKARFEYLEEKVNDAGKDLKNMNLEEMDVYWEEAKKALKEQG